MGPQFLVGVSPPAPTEIRGPNLEAYDIVNSSI